ncbi:MULTISPECIES: copper-binding protein [unclassified Massilia]|uniref:copper-binding protein n=1 Tax=unclassified Massilia TaxID=2609279 RepID=UPI001B8303C7|nr:MULTISPECIES: copper-binding protein [unclassified Massilia]MBQ5939482.1 copper-binding protein [Massilia sp. AB1]MBQ5962055.1 copper-binding protein [Massilia sp. ZL223]
MKAITRIAAALVLSAACTAVFAQHGGHDGDGHARPAATAELADGEVKKIDRETGKITLRHGELKNLNMAPMTMVFRVKDAAMLDQVKAGDKVRFSADRVNGALTVVQLQAAQ